MRRLLPFLLIGLLASCSPPSFVAHRYDNFTAYYNTFYNAKQAFESGIQTLESSTAPIDRARYLPVFVPPEQAAYAQDFEYAIQKSADVLRDHPNSKWVDDALMLIGKSYFYRQNYVGAAQKFREIIALGGGLEGEARFWLARTLIASGEYETAADHLRQSLDGTTTYGRWTDVMHLVRGELFVRQGAWEEAVVALDRGLSGDPDERAGARAAFLLGQVRETMGIYNASARAFEYVNEAFQPSYELSYAARVSAIRVRGLYGDTREALRRLQRMERDDKHFDKRVELMLLRAWLYRTQGHEEIARRLLRTLLYDETSTPGAVSGRAHYALGTLYESAFDDFSMAAAHFDTAATRLRPENSSAGGALLGYAPAAITDAEAKAQLFGQLAERAEAVSRLDSLLHLGSLDDAAFEEHIAMLRRRRARAQALSQEIAAERRAAERFTGGQIAVRGPSDREPETTTTSNAGTSFLFHRDPVRAQQARRSFEQRWGRRPLVPNWRRIEAIAAQRETQPAVADATPEDALTNAVGTDSTAGVLVDVSAVPRDSASQAQMRAQRAVARYELANTLFLAAGRPDSAAALYRRVIEEDTQQPVARRALYALAEVHQAQGDTVTARRMYRQIADEYPSSPFAQRARERLDLAEPVMETDSLLHAEAAYEQAYAAWEEQRDTTALRSFVDLALRFARTPVAPKALWASGTLFLQEHAEERRGLNTLLPPMYERVLRPADTTAVLRASRGTSVGLLGGRRYTIRELLTFIADRYPASPHAQRAKRLLGVAEDSASSAADSLVAGARTDSVSTDSLAADSTTLRRTVSTDSLATDSSSTDTTVMSRSAPPDTAAAVLPAPSARDTAQQSGPWAIVVASRPNRADAALAREGYRAQFRDEGLTVELLESVVDGTAWYRVAVGAYADRQSALTAMAELSEQLPAEARVLRVR